MGREGCQSTDRGLLPALGGRCRARSLHLPTVEGDPADDGRTARHLRKPLRGTLISDPDVPPDLKQRWDDLAVDRGRPYCAPAWMLAWWASARPAGAALRLVAVKEEDALVGVVPFFAERTGGRLVRYRLLASSVSAHVEPLAEAGSERAVAAAAVDALSAGADGPHIVSLSGVSSHSPWPAVFEAAWAGDRGAALSRGPGMPAPRLRLEGTSYEEWFAGLSRHRRSELRRRRRRLEEAGAAIRLVSDVGEIHAALADFSDLHHGRWKRRGGSGVLDRGVEAMLVRAADELVPSSRLRLWCIEVEGRPICSSLFLAAGGTLSYWLGGFDERWGQYGPAIETVRAALEHAWSVGDRLLDLGPGGQHYKYTFAEGEETLHSFDLVPGTAGALGARLWLAPEHTWARMKHARYEAVRRLPPGIQQRFKALRKRLRPPV